MLLPRSIHARPPISLRGVRSRQVIRYRHTYADAISALNGLQSNYAIVNEIRRNRHALNQAAIPEMLDWLQQAGYEQSDLKPLGIIHIAGTKGKGSTATFISSILNQYRLSGVLGNVGLYTSPHLRFVRERIQLNGQMISEDAFTAAFFELWQRFEKATAYQSSPIDGPRMPVYFRYLTLMALHIFSQQEVNTAVIECGIGGEYDSTNIVSSPTVTAITALGYDHVEILGKELSEIAWHKAGIMKPGVAAFTVPQPPGAQAILEERARERKVRLQVVHEHPQLLSKTIKLGLEGSFQRMNASLAIAVVSEHLGRLGMSRISTDTLPAEFIRGLENAHIGGRCETRREPFLTWHLDGAHTVESIRVATEWFAESFEENMPQNMCTRNPPCILIFNQQTRDAQSLLKEVYRNLTKGSGPSIYFSHVIFCSNKTFRGRGYSSDLVSINTNSEAVDSLAVQKRLAEVWKNDIRGGGVVSVLASIEEAVALARKVAKETGQQPSEDGAEARILVTGSVHLVGGVLEVLET